MTTDWKELLSGLKASGDIPEDNGSDSSAAAESQVTENEKTASRKRRKLNIFYEKKGRAGKPATIITGFDPEDPDEAAGIAAILKKRLGSGGSARGGEILLQGDRRDQLRAILPSLGYRL